MTINMPEYLIRSRLLHGVYYRDLQKIHAACQEYNNVLKNLADQPIFLSLNNKWSLDPTDTRHPALFYAVYHNYYEVTETLLELGANPNVKTIKYLDDDVLQTPLWIAASKTQDIAMTSLLLKYGAEMPKELSLSTEVQNVIAQAKAQLEKERTQHVLVLNESIPEAPMDLTRLVASYL